MDEDKIFVCVLIVILVFIIIFLIPDGYMIKAILHGIDAIKEFLIMYYYCEWY